MQKKRLFVTMIITHLLCVILGYSFASIHTKSNEQAEIVGPKEDIVPISSEDIPVASKGDLEITTDITDTINSEENDIAEATEQAASGSTISGTLPTESQQDPTEMPGTHPPATELPNIGGGGQYETDRDY